MKRMAHSKTMSMRKKDNMTSAPGGNTGRTKMDKSHRNYAAGRRQGGPFGK